MSILFRYGILTLALVLVVACGAPQARSASVSFMVWGDPAEKAAYQQLVQQYSASHPDITIQMTHIPGQSDYRQRLGADFAAGTPPDIMLLNYRRYGAFAAKAAIEPLEPYLQRSKILRKDAFYPKALAPFHWRGVLHCIPQNLSSLVVYYNKSLFDRAGLAYPQDNWTLEDFLGTAKALTIDVDGDGRTDQYGVGIAPTLIRLAPFVWQNSGDLVFNPDAPTRLALDKPEATEAMQWFVDLQVKHNVVPNAVDEQAEDSESRFLSGRTAMLFESRRIVPTLREINTFDWDVAPLPRGRQPASILHADAYCMAAKTANKEAAWSFIEFANSAEGQRIVAKTGRTVPSLQAVAQSSAFLEPGTKPEHSQVFLDVIPDIRSVPITGNWPDVEEIVDNELERAFFGQATVAEVIATANARTVEFLRLRVEQPPGPGAVAGKPPDQNGVAACIGSTTIPRPAILPAMLPLADGAIFLQSYEYPGQNKQYLLAAIPLEFDSAAEWYRTHFERGGFTWQPGDAEPGEIDMLFQGKGLNGNLRLAALPNCVDMTALEFLLQQD